MATYAQIIDRVKLETGKSCKTCWVAHVMADHGLTTRISPNRVDRKTRKHPCPPDKRPAIESALRHYGMI